MAQLSCIELSVGFESKEILSDLNFSIEGGNYLCIVGENGSGKTTLMRTLLGLHSPMKGRLVLGDGVKHNEIGYLPQQTQLQRDFPASVWEIVLSGCQGRCGIRPFYSKVQKERARGAIKRLGIEELVGRSYRELSGGQQQKVLLARALCAAQKLLLLDEPVSALDEYSASEMYRLLSELNKKDGMTVIMISHDLSAALEYATHILHIGKTVFFGTKEEFLKTVEKGNAKAGRDMND